MRGLYVTIWCILLGSWALAEEFVLPKSNKKQSTRTLKETCNDRMFEALKISPAIARHNADVQQLGLDLMPAMLEGEFFSAMSKDQLDACCNELQLIFERQTTINALLEEQKASLRTLKGKSRHK